MWINVLHPVSVTDTVTEINAFLCVFTKCKDPMGASASGFHTTFPKAASAEREENPCKTVLEAVKLILAFPVCPFLFCWDIWHSTGHQCTKKIVLHSTRSSFL